LNIGRLVVVSENYRVLFLFQLLYFTSYHSRQLGLWARSYGKIVFKRFVGNKTLQFTHKRIKIGGKEFTGEIFGEILGTVIVFGGGKSLSKIRKFAHSHELR
jgi:hypothetical protein